MKRIIMSFGMALAGITGFKATTQNNSVSASETVKTAKAKKKKSQLNNSSDSLVDQSDLGFYKAILKGLGVKETLEKLKFFQAWRQGEGGQARNNPFNTSMHVAGNADTKYNSHGVRNYPNRQAGLEATLATLKLSFYKEIVDLLKKDAVTAKELAHTRALKKWGTGAMVKKVLASGKIDPPEIAI